MKRATWGYKIDYAAAIREDETLIKHLSSELCILIARELLPAARAAFPSFEGWDLYQIITRDAEGLEARARRCGLTLADMRAWAYFTNESREDVWTVLGDDQPGDYTRGKAIDAWLGHYTFAVCSEEKRRLALSKARASLARHKRNAARNGW